MKFVPAYGKHYCTTENPAQLDGLLQDGGCVFLANIPLRPQNSSVTKDNVRSYERYLVCLHLTHPSDETNQPCLHSFPENNLSLLTKQTDQPDWQSTQSEVELETRGLMSTSSSSCADNREFVVFAVSTIPKAEITEVEITHSIKETERKLYNL